MRKITSFCCMMLDVGCFKSFPLVQRVSLLKVSSDSLKLQALGEPTAEDLCNEGRRMISLGELDEGFQKLIRSFSIDSLFDGIKNGFEEYYRARIDLDNHDIDAHEGMAVLYQDWGKYDEAVKYFDACIELSGNGTSARNRWFASLFSCKAAVCNWDSWIEDSKYLSKMVQYSAEDANAPPCIHPFDSLSLPLNVSEHKTVAENYAKSISSRMNVTKMRILKDEQLTNRTTLEVKNFAVSSNRYPIRVGYVSGDLMGTHPLLFLMRNVFVMHDKSKFDIYLYALNPHDGSAARQELEDHSPKQFIFRDISNLPAYDAYKVIREDKCQMLINLNGYAGTVKSVELFSLRPCNIAFSYMGFPGTMGCDFIDYIIADNTVIPLECSPYYSEKVVRLPNSYFVNNHMHDEDAIEALNCEVPSRSAFSIPSDAVVVCNFNRSHKLDPQTFSQWLEILREKDNVVLWLLDGGTAFRNNIERFVRRKGISKDRVIFGPIVSRKEHLIRMRVADIFADSFPYSAHTVGCDALWAGIPIVTLQGTSMASRVAASLLNAANLSEFVSSDRTEYLSKLKKLCESKDALREAKEKVKISRIKSPVFNTELWVKNLEEALSHIWEKYQNGVPPGDANM